QVLEQTVILMVQLLRGSDPAGGKRSHHLRNLARNHIRGHADDPMGPHGHKWQRQSVITAHDLKIRPQCCAQLTDAIGIPARFLNTDDIAALPCKSAGSLYANFHSASAGDTIEHNWQLRLARHRPKMLK